MPPPEALEPPTYPLHDCDGYVTQAGVIYFENSKIYVSKALAGQRVGLGQLETGTWLLSFMQMDLGYIDIPTTTIIPLPN